MSMQALMDALAMPEDVWEAAEAERESQRMHDEFIAKWLPVWREWGHTMPGYEQYLVAK